ncbi:MAG TPA: mechanosensitive ion channel domain-containing protein [Puia sp.]|nr:mechanosensitive ion channel domain-containing protein [Puia sp.]
MPDFWNQVILSNPVKRYIFVATAIILGLLFRRILSRYLAGLLFRVVKRIGSGVDKDSFVNLLIAPLESFLLILVTIVSVEKLHFPEAFDFDVYEINVKIILQGIATSVLIIAFFWLLLRIIDFVAMILEWKANASKDMRDNQLITFFRDFLKAVISIIGLLMVLGIAFGFEVKNVWTGLGIAGAALALATKESIENLIASFIIFFDKPFTIGDILKVNNITGTVEKIGLRSTRIRTDLKTYVTVPNKQMVDSIVDNQTLRTQRKAEIRLQIGLSASAGKIQQLIDGIRRILKKDKIENPTVFLNDIGGNAFLIHVDFFTPPIALNAFNDIKQQVNFEILDQMEAIQVELAAATTDVKIIGNKEKGVRNKE